MHLVIHTDGGARGNPGPAGIGIVFLADGKDDAVLYEEGKFIGDGKTNNEAEYTAFYTSAQVLQKNVSTWNPSSIEWQQDSKLVVEQLNRKWKIKEPRMQQFAKDIWQVLATLQVPYKIAHIPRELNSAADALYNQALDAQLS
jgi:ribonuclease HI